MIPARHPTVEWQVAGACNYDCSYCIQSPKYRKGRPSEAQIDAAIANFAALPGVWEIKCSGGEAFAHPLFLARVVPALMSDTPHTISVLTNFSANRVELARFATLTRGRLRVFSASLHLEFADVADFVAKAVWFRTRVDPDVAFVVNQVVLPGRLTEAAASKSVVEAAGLRWFPQLYKTKGGVADYPDAAALSALIGRDPSPRQANLAPSYKGRLCWAGVDYFTVDKDGAAWSCRTAKRHGQGQLGNLYSGAERAGSTPRSPASVEPATAAPDARPASGPLTRRTTPAPCPWNICPCTVPANRGMIEGVGAGASE